MVEKHQDKSGKSSRYICSFNSVKLVYSEKYATRSEAMKREAEIKKMSKKERLIKKNKIYSVFVGRFAPFHLGHQMIIDAMIKKFGIENILIIIGSSTSYTERTPYTFTERKRMIRKIYPKLQIYPLPDIKPELSHYDGTTNEIWLGNIKRLEKKIKGEFIFCGGSKKDLKILAQRFKTKVVMSRKTKGLNISATIVREALKNGDVPTLKKTLDSKILKLAIMGYNNYRGKRN